MSKALLLKENRYLSSDMENEGGLLLAKDLLPAKVVENALVCAGTVDKFTVIEALLTAVGRLHEEGKTCYILLEDEGAFSPKAKQRIEELELKDHVLTVSEPEAFKEACREYIDLFALGQNTLFYEKSQKFTDNQADAIYRELKSIF